ncbi:helix-turn-helix domain-containing protein [Paludisphaera mucosa]|uniref:Helix-turn-helix domain-containing protein n=1 Tax=Paludisphaera mucosa TaxID=3030827 RepID=A0ABT6F7B1_9BACT|nr:helix-turn-helix domain-containing protein [Paludisphaera mucosa]MDG3003298.1 helix-turn-helix domain-containing protein [Paludisphaera mucosa]
MAQFYTLEEAARVLGMSPEELKAKAQQREVRAFLDGGTWRFRVVDVDELARRHGLGSDAELRLSDLEVPAASAGDLDELDLSEFQLGVAKPDLGNETMQFGATGRGADEGSEHDLMIDDLSVPPNPVTGSSSVIIGMSSGGKRPSDSDVRLVPDNLKGASDSDVRLAAPIGRVPSDSDVTLIKDDTSEHGLLAGAGASDSSVRPGSLLGSSAEVPAAGSSDSDFELNPSSELVDALQPESGSDFELSALDASDEFEATPLKPSDSDVTAADPNLSGINLSRPSDSGINLLGSFNGGGAESIELAPLSDEEVPSRKGAKPPAAAPAKPKASLSATPPPAVKKGEKDIFDDTDFEVDAALDDESDDKTVQLNAGSDFDLEDSDSASEVFAIDEEDVDINAATAMAPSGITDDDDDDEDDGFDDAVSSEMATAWASDDSPTSSASTPGVVISREAAVDWDGLSVGLLAVASLFIFLSSFLAFDLVRNLYDFHEGGPASGLVKSISGLFFS